jgi:hypothetical protein
LGLLIKSKDIALKALLGGVSGFFGFLIISLFDNPWEEIIVAALIGSVAGVVDKSKAKTISGILFCSVGLFFGLLLSIYFGEQLNLPLGAWGVAGFFLGLNFGIYDRSILRTIFGFILGLVAGLLAESFEFLPIFFDAIKFADRQMIALISAGFFINLFLAFIQQKKTKNEKRQ